MEYQFSSVITDLKPSFVREILKLTVNKEIISFAGGLPDPKLFPQDDILQATKLMFGKYKGELFQYSTTEGHIGLRQWIASEFSKNHEIDVTSEQVLIVSGSQQALDLVGKVFIDAHDTVVMESPSYLGAIQAFSMYRPKFEEVDLTKDGVDTGQLAKVMAKKETKFFYGIPNFQNPTGITYSAQKRSEVAEILKQSGKIMLEDDPYGFLRFDDREESTKSIYSLAPNNIIYLGTFSKIFVPGFRIGWVIAPVEIIQKLVVAKQAADLHTNSFVQSIIYEYIENYNLNTHIELIKTTYAKKKHCMVEAIKTYMGDQIEIYPSFGGMFIWINVPNISSIELLNYAIKENVAFVPGEVFSLTGGYKDFMRLNFTSLDYNQIEEGVKRLQKAVLAYRKDYPIES